MSPKKQPKMSVVESAWAAFREEIKTDNLDELRAEGWMTVVDCAEAMGLPWTVVRNRLERNAGIEKRQVVSGESGQRRKVNIYRPRVLQSQK